MTQADLSEDASPKDEREEPKQSLLRHPCPLGEFVSLIDLGYRYAHVNAAHADAHQTTPDKIVGRRVDDIWGKDTFEESIRPHLDRCLADEVVHYRSWFHFPETGRRYWEVSYYPYREDGKGITHAMVVTRDVTHQKNASDLLGIQTDVLNLVARRTPLGETFERMGELVESAIPGSHFFATVLDPQSGILNFLTAPDFTHAGLKRLAPLKPGLESGSCGLAIHLNQPVVVENVPKDPHWEEIGSFAKEFCITSSISHPYRDEAGTAVGTVAIYYTFGREIEEFHHEILENVSRLAGIAAENKRVEEERSRLSTATEQTAESIAITDLDGSIQYVNPAFESCTGYLREEILGKKISILDSGEPSAESHTPIWRTLEQGEVWSGRSIRRKKDGTLYHEEATVSPVRNETGETTCYVSVQRDVTDRLVLEEQLLQSQKMEAVGQLAGGVAHDFNNILQAASGYAEMASMKLGDDEPTKANLEEVIKAVKRGGTLVRQLLTFSRRETMRRENVDLNAVIGEMIKMLRRVIGEHIELVVVPGPDLHTVYADTGHIEQVLMNLCVNSRDAMPKGGKITIETGNVHLRSEDLESEPGAREGVYVSLRVTDTGVGMPPEVRDRVFEPFFTTKDVDKGTGLGLATVYGIVKQHEGIIRVESEIGKGTTFAVYLPPMTAGARADTAGTAQETPPKAGTEKILLAEDDDQVRELASQILASAGYRVVTARDGADAISIFEKKPGDFDIAVLDVVMPKKSGREVYFRIRALRPDLPVLFSSGYDRDLLEEDFEMRESTELILKPFRGPDLLQRVRDVLDRE